MNEITGAQAEALAALLVTLRPGQRAWTKGACLDAIRDAWNSPELSRDVRELTQAAMNAALDPTVATPAVVAMSGRHWEKRSRQGEPARATACRCGDTHMPSAPCRQEPPATDAGRHLAAMRAQLPKNRPAKETE